MLGITVDWNDTIIGIKIPPNEKTCLLSYTYQENGKWHSNREYIEDDIATVHKRGKRDCDTPEEALKPLEAEVRQLAENYNQAKQRAKQLRDMAPDTLTAQVYITFNSDGFPLEREEKWVAEEMIRVWICTPSQAKTSPQPPYWSSKNYNSDSRPNSIAPAHVELADVSRDQ